MAEVNIERRDRRIQWWLLVTSLATLALLIVAALDENAFPQWRSTRIRQASILREKAIDARGRMIAQQFQLTPDQQVLPELRRVDRCVTCHAGIDDPRLADQPQPFRAHPGDWLSTHPPKQFGCTICHQGQGRATELPDAHGRVPYWPEPMRPGHLVLAGCGTCHAPLGVPDLAGLERARNLIERSDCLACHRIDGRGGTLRAGEPEGSQGPDLSHVGVRGFDPRWYTKHMERRATAEDGPWKHSFGPLDPPAREMIEAFLWSRIGAPRLVEAKAQFHALGCQGCHKVRGVGGDDGPELTTIGERLPHTLDFSHVPGPRTLANWLGHHLRWPARVVPDSQMPALGLDAGQIDLLVLYLLSLRGNHLPADYWPNDRVRVERLGQREFSPDGATLYRTLCGGCHGPEGQGRRFPGTVPFPAVAHPDFLAVASDPFLTETIRQGRPGRRMPGWDENRGGLEDHEIRRIVAHLRRLAATEPPEEEMPSERRWVQADPVEGQRLFTTHCASCHGAQGEGTDAPALNNPVLLATASDTYLVQTIGRGRPGTAMPGFARPSPAYPTLAPDQIEAIVAHIRSWEPAAPAEPGGAPTNNP